MQQTRDIIVYDIMEVNENEDRYIDESFESDDEALSDYDSSETSLVPNDSTSQVSTNSSSVSCISKTSSIWEFFDKNSNTGKPRCRTCKMEFSKSFQLQLCNVIYKDNIWKKYLNYDKENFSFQIHTFIMKVIKESITIYY